MSSEFSPNVIEAQKEKDALNECYQTAMRKAKGRGVEVENLLQQFEKMVETESHAVVNMKTAVLKKLIENTGEFYKNHYEMGKHDTDREKIDLQLFGEAGKKIRYAALSFDGNGLTAYGNCHCHVQLLPAEEMQSRVSLLKRNSFLFRDRPVPPGYRATWEERSKLAVAKVAKDIDQTISLDHFHKLLLTDVGDKERKIEDEFIEVHIYDAFDLRAIASVRGTPQQVEAQEEKEKEELEFDIVKKTLGQQGKWKK